MKWNNLLLYSLLFVDVHALRRIEDFKEPASQPQKEVLVVVSGLMRDYVNKWPIWQKTLIEPNEKRGVKFTIAVETDLRAQCDAKESGISAETVAANFPDIPFHETDQNFNCHCHGAPNVDGASSGEMNFEKKTNKSSLEGCAPIFEKIGPEEKQKFVRRIREVFHPQVIDMIIDDETTNRAEMQIIRTGRIGLKMSEKHMDKLKKGHFDMVLGIRPDMVLVNATDGKHSAKNSPVLDLQDVCSTHPGLNVISGDFTREWVFHDRDWDWGQLLCDGSKFKQVSEVLVNHMGTCAGNQCPNGKPPAVPSDFKSTKGLECNTYICKWVADMKDLNMRFGTLDDIVFGHIRR